MCRINDGNGAWDVRNGVPWCGINDENVAWDIRRVIRVIYCYVFIWKNSDAVLVICCCYWDDGPVLVSSAVSSSDSVSLLNLFVANVSGFWKRIGFVGGVAFVDGLLFLSGDGCEEVFG